ATVTDLEVELIDNTKDPYIGNPLLSQINGSGGSNPLWENSSSPSEGTNGAKITLTNTISILKGSIVTFDLVFANTSGGYFDVNDMTVNVTIYYTGGYDTLELFDTPITTFQDQTQTRYFRADSHIINGLSAYQLGTSRTATVLQLNERSDRLSGEFTVTWGIRVWIRHADNSETELTGGTLRAIVQRSSDGAGIQSNTWTPAETDIVETDALVIRVYMEIGSTTYGPVEFTTEQLGAVKLLSSTWTIFYHTERDYQGFPQVRTRGIFSWGDISVDSQVANIQIRTLGGGGSGSNFSEFSKPINPSLTPHPNFINSLLVELRTIPTNSVSKA
ncbi:MAG: hypothetical protein ACTSPV_11015, partial [Candidatus Hodarchaeales archaeon]